jgi:hypothetical protein
MSKLLESVEHSFFVCNVKIQHNFLVTLCKLLNNVSINSVTYDKEMIFENPGLS